FELATVGFAQPFADRRVVAVGERPQEGGHRGRDFFFFSAFGFLAVGLDAVVAAGRGLEALGVGLGLFGQAGTVGAARGAAAALPGPPARAVARGAFARALRGFGAGTVAAAGARAARGAGGGRRGRFGVAAAAALGDREDPQEGECCP